MEPDDLKHMEESLERDDLTKQKYKTIPQNLETVFEKAARINDLAKELTYLKNSGKMVTENGTQYKGEEILQMLLYYKAEFYC